MTTKGERTYCIFSLLGGDLSLNFGAVRLQGFKGFLLCDNRGGSPLTPRIILF
jgi:hypothetical protein